MNIELDPGSFRDPGGRIFSVGGKLYRAVFGRNEKAHAEALSAGVYERLAEQGLLLGAVPVDLSGLPVPEGTLAVMEHPRIPFVSYPYEWSFALHRAAALLHLDVHIEAMASNFTLSDASAYNVQFRGTRPVFIDHLSLKPYQDGKLWIGHRQFCMQFLNPLVFWDRIKLPPNPWFRGNLEGIAPEELAPLLKLRDRLSWTIMAHVIAQARFQKRQINTKVAQIQTSSVRLSRNAFLGMLSGLRDYIAKLKINETATEWSDYTANTSYSDDGRNAKLEFVREMVSATRPNQMLDLGCNTGDYSLAAVEAGAGYVVGFDFDHGALDKAFHRFSQREVPILPLWMDAANPSPSQGWSSAERKSFQQRINADALIALAFVHHIAISRNVPLPMVVDWIVDLAPVGVIEFVPKSDPMVKRLLATREDIFDDYDEDVFMTGISNQAKIVSKKRLPGDGRLLVWYDRSN